MAIPDYMLCDVCSDPTRLPRLSILEDRICDAAGDMENVYQYYDLCSKCTHTILKHIIYHLEKNEGALYSQDLIKLIEKLKVT